MSEIKLLKCPFCGGEANMVLTPMNGNIFSRRKQYYVSCYNIGCEMQCSTKLCFTEAEATEIWNKRSEK